MQKIIFRQNDHPLIILYFPQQIDQLIHFCSRNPLNGPLSTLGIDTTFNVSAYYATVSVFKNTAVFRRSDSRYNSPVMLGPILLSSDQKEKTFREFLSEIRNAILDARKDAAFPTCEILNVGSDQDKALTNAIQTVFPDSTKFLCIQHLRDDFERFLRDKLGVPVSERGKISHIAFSPLRENNAGDSLNSLESTLSTYLGNSEKDQKIREYFRKNILSNLIAQMENASHFPTETEFWTNNQCESMNRVIKTICNWEPQSISDLVSKLQTHIAAHLTDLRRALFNEGQFALRPPYSAFALNRERWFSLSPQNRQQHFLAFLRGNPKSIPGMYETSSDGLIQLPKKSSLAKKPSSHRRAPAHKHPARPILKANRKINRFPVDAL